MNYYADATYGTHIQDFDLQCHEHIKQLRDMLVLLPHALKIIMM